jgi:hypothetical protein
MPMMPPVVGGLGGDVGLGEEPGLGLGVKLQVAGPEGYPNSSSPVFGSSRHCADAAAGIARSATQLTKARLKGRRRRSRDQNGKDGTLAGAGLSVCRVS